VWLCAGAREPGCEPRLKRAPLVGIAIGTAHPNMFGRRERRLVDQIPHHFLGRCESTCDSRDKGTLAFECARIEKGILATERGRQEREEVEDNRDAVLARR